MLTMPDIPKIDIDMPVNSTAGTTMMHRASPTCWMFFSSIVLYESGRITWGAFFTSLGTIQEYHTQDDDLPITAVVMAY